MADLSASEDRRVRAVYCCHRGNDASEKGRIRDAIRYFAIGANLSYGPGGHHPTALSLGLCGLANVFLFATNNPAKALKLLDCANYAYPLTPFHLVLRSTALSNLSRFSEALETVDQVLLADPSELTAYFAKVSALNSSGRQLEAYEVLQAGLKLNPDSKELQDMVAAMARVINGHSSAVNLVG